MTTVRAAALVGCKRAALTLVLRSYRLAARQEKTLRGAVYWVRRADVAAIGSYRSQQTVLLHETLVYDDVSQFTGFREDLRLCWVHEGRHYKNPSPVIPVHQTLLDEFRGRSWTCYEDLRAYQQTPTAAAAT